MEATAKEGLKGFNMGAGESQDLQQVEQDIKILRTISSELYLRHSEIASSGHYMFIT